MSEESNRFADYLCMMMSTGTEVKLNKFDEISSNSLQDYEKRCESKYVDKGQAPICRLIKRSDWLDPDTKKSCYKVKKNDDGTFTKIIDDTTGKPARYYTIMECNKNPNTTTYELDDPERSVINLASYPLDDQISGTQNIIVLFTLISLILIYLFWYIKFDVKRPYYLYDYISKNVIIRIFIILILSGVIFFIFCPFDVCFLPLFAAKFRKQPLNAVHNQICTLESKITKNPNSMGCVEGNFICNKIPWFPGCSPNNDLYMGWVKAYNYDNTKNNYRAS